MLHLVRYLLLLPFLRSFSLAKPITANALADPPVGLPDSWSPSSILLAESGHDLSARTSLTIHTKNLTTASAHSTSSSKLLQAWPETPFEIPIQNQEEAHAHINVFATYREARDAQTKEAVDLINGEIIYLQAHPAAIGPKELNVEADFTTIWLGCHAWVGERSRWTGEVAIDMLKTLKLFVDVEGFVEAKFDVLSDKAWLAMCQLMLHAPYAPDPGPVTKLTIA